jgi:HSP20 family molecular chaperone IbpA
MLAFRRPGGFGPYIRGVCGVRLKSGILEMTMPKTEAEKRHKIPIEEV